MNTTKIWLSSPHMGGAEQNFVNEAFDTNWVAPLGPNVSGFETDIEQFLDHNVHVAALSSGTAALHLGLILLGVKAGDLVICQSFTFSASANPIAYQGAIPVFVDSESTTWNMCPEALETALKTLAQKGQTPKAIIAVHLYGMPFQAEALRAVADKYGVPILEDSAEALGSTYKGQKCGSFGDIGILSFNGNKIITTSGGGALVSHDRNVKEKAVFLATQAREPFPHYEHREIGYNYRLSNICAGIGRGQMQVLEKHIGLRRAMNARYVDYCSTIEGVSVLAEPSADFYSNHWLSAIVIDPERAGQKTREGLRLALEAANIESRPLWKPMHLQPVFADAAYFGSNVSAQLFENGLCLPSGSNLTEADCDRIFAVMDDFFK